LEDPIEYVHASGKSLISQRELGVHFASFGRAIRSALREDPDVLMVGELRDADAAQAAIGAAETGQLVLASLHTRSAAEAVHRMESFFPAAQQQEIRAQLAAVIEAMISQELLPGKDGGRVLASEVLVATDAVRHLIRSGKPEQLASCIVSGASFGMQTLRQDIERLAAQNKLNAETARRRIGKAK
jgi:twitching motility protein PilT